MAQIKQIKVGGTTYDIEPASQTALSSTIVKDALGYTPVNKAGDTVTGNLTVETLTTSTIDLTPDMPAAATISTNTTDHGVTIDNAVGDVTIGHQNIILNTDKESFKAYYGTKTAGNEIATKSDIPSTDGFVAKTGDTMTGNLLLTSYRSHGGSGNSVSPKVSVEGGLGTKLELYDDSTAGATINKFGTGLLNITADDGINIQNSYDKNIHIGHVDTTTGLDIGTYQVDIHTEGNIKLRSTSTAQDGKGIVFDNYRFLNGD